MLTMVIIFASIVLVGVGLNYFFDWWDARIPLQEWRYITKEIYLNDNEKELFL